MSEYEAVADVPIWVPPLYILYPVTATLSVEAVQERLICDDDMDVAEREVGVEGGVVSDVAVNEAKMV